MRTCKGRILLADDEEKNRRLLRDILESEGYNVTLAEDGQQALEKVFAEPPDVVLLDIMMPKLDGYAVCSQLRKDSRTAHLPIMIITALKDRADMLKGIRAGANDFLTKPIDAEEIRLRVKNAALAKQLNDKVQETLVKLRELEMLRDNLTHMIVHDMRSPLMVASGSFAMITNEQDRLSPTQKEFATMGEYACRELIEMVTSLLDVSRMEAGKMPINRVSCDIREMAQTAVDSVAVLVRKKNLTLRVTGDSVCAAVDPDITHRVLVNLLGNAIKFSPEGGTLGIGITSTGRAVRVTVSDQGPGIPQEYHQRIFDKFGQVESRKENRKYSTGLGLAFCKLAVEAQGGQIGVESPSTGLPPSPGSSGEASRAGAVGAGSLFWFSLPHPEYPASCGPAHRG
jgi:two-component system, sensor histidine kinase and response regulator